MNSSTDARSIFSDLSPTIEGATIGPLRGLVFAAKDLFDVAGHVTGCGNPSWLATHGPATVTAEAIELLVEAGASLKGKTHTDELAYSLNGENFFYGTPPNPRAPDRIPGGSSSGSASAVAMGVCDFALGTDTGGSIRVPASYCGLYGMRPSHGRISVQGCAALAPSFDTVGWFAPKARLLARVGAVLLGGGTDPQNHTSAPWLFAEHLLSLCDLTAREAIAARVAQLERQVGSIRRVIISDELSAWADAFRILQGAEAWRQHGEWILQENPKLGPGISDRFARAASLTSNEVESAKDVQRSAVVKLDGLLGGGAILIMPTTPFAAPAKCLSQSELEPLRQRILSLTCPAGLAGLPQVTLPLDTTDGVPVGLSILAGRGSDEQLLAATLMLARNEASAIANG